MPPFCSHAAVARRLTALCRHCASFFLLPQRGRRSLSLVLLALILSVRADAQSVWNTTTGTWSTAGSWSPASVPVSDSATSLIFGGSASYTATNDIGNFILNQLLFTNTAGTVSIAGSPTTNALDFTNASSDHSMLSSVTLSGAGSATISAPVIWDGETTVTHSGSGTLQFSGPQTYTNGTKQTFINSGTGTLTLADGITYANSGTNTGLVLNLINNSATTYLNIGDMGGVSNVTLNIGGTGIVRYSGSSANDLFSGSAVLNILSGATFDFNTNAETMGAISGGGTILETGAGLTVSLAGYYVFSGKLSGTGSSANLTLSGTSQTLVLSGSASDYAGATVITAGRLIVSANAPSGSAGALGSATSDVLVGNTSGANIARLLIDTAGVSIGRNVRLQSGNTAAITVGGLNASGTVTYSGNVILGTDNGVAKGITLASVSGGTVEFTGGLLRATGATGVTDTVTLTGGGTVAFRAANTFTGATTVSGGMLLLDDTTDNGSKLSATASLTLNGGSISLAGSSSASSSETVASLTLGNNAAPLGGGARIMVTSGTDQDATLVLNAITRNTGATVNFDPVGTGSGTASITTTTANNTSASTGNHALNILGAYATYKLNDWAVNDGSGNIVALDAGSYSSSFGTGLHTSLSASFGLAAGGVVTNTLRLTGASAVTFSAATDTLTLESGGILVASTAGATSIGTTSKRGIIATSTGELIVHQQSASTLTINSTFGGSLGITKSGDGLLVLTGTNTYTGNTVINGGSLAVTASANLGTGTTGLTLNGATLIIASGSIGTVGNDSKVPGHVITIGSAGATFNFSVMQTVQGSGLTGTGTLTLSGTGGIAVGTSTSTFSGDIVINNGVLRMYSQQFTSVPSITVNNGGTYEVNDDATSTFGANSANGRLLINGKGFGENGAIRVTDQTTGSAFANPKTTIVNEVALQSTSRIQVENGTAFGSLSQLIITGTVTGPGGLDKTGNGALTLTSRDNSYGGSTLVENGVLRIDLGNDRLPTGTTVTLGTGTTSGVLQLNGFSQSIAGLTTEGTGTANAVIGGSATSTSLLDVTVDSGTQTYGGSLGGVGLTSYSADYNNLGFIKDGAGAFVLAGAGSYTGATTVNEGTLVLGDARALGGTGTSLASGAGGTTVNAGATLDLNGQTDVQEIITLNGSGVGGAGALVNNNGTAASIGSGVASLSLAGVFTTGWSAGATVAVDSSPGGASATATAQLGLGAGSITLTSGGSGYGLAPTVTVGGGSGAVVIASVGVTSASYTVTSNTTTYMVAPTVTLSNGATGVANLDANGKVVSITVTNAGSNFVGTPTATFSGGTVLVAGTDPKAAGNNTNYTVVGLTIVNPGTGFNSTPTVTITGGTGAAATAVGNDGAFVLNGVSLDASGDGYTSTPAVSISGGTASAAANVTSVNLATDSSVGGSGDLTINAVISGGGALTKVGAGTTTLAAANTYAGTTTVSEGTLQVGQSGSGSSGAGAMTVNGSTAVLAGTGSVTGDTSVILGMIKPGDNAGAATGTLNTHDLSFVPVASSTVAELQITGSSAGSTLAFDQIHVTGSLTLSSNGGILVDGASYTAAVGDTFTLLDWSGVITLNGFSTGTDLRTGANSAGNEGNLDLPDITGVGLWQISTLLDAGALTLTIVAVPEPARGMLLLCGGLLMAWRRRR